MNMQPRYNHDQREILLAKPFAVHCPIPNDIQDEIARLMAASVVQPKPTPPVRQGHPQELIDAVRAKISEGIRDEHIAHDLGLSPKTLYNIIRKYGLPTARHRISESFAERNALILKMHRSGHSTRYIGDKVGLSHNSVQKILRKVSA